MSRWHAEDWSGYASCLSRLTRAQIGVVTFVGCQHGLCDLTSLVQVVATHQDREYMFVASCAALSWLRHSLIKLHKVVRLTGIRNIRSPDKLRNILRWDGQCISGFLSPSQVSSDHRFCQPFAYCYPRTTIEWLHLVYVCRHVDTFAPLSRHNLFHISWLL